MSHEREKREIQTLQSLGLTLNQARVYTALIKFETATAKKLSSISGLAACDVYRVIPELGKLGLLDEIVTSPKEFRGTSPKEAMEILLKEKERDVEKMKIMAREILSEMIMEKSREQLDLTKMALIPFGERANQFGKPKILSTKEQLCAVQTNTLFHRFIGNTADDLEELLKGKTEIRFILENAKATEKPIKDLSNLLKNPNFKVRFSKDKIKACILLHDNTDVFVSTTTDTLHTPSYWSTNPCMVAVVRGYFEAEWHKATKNYTAASR